MRGVKKALHGLRSLSANDPGGVLRSWYWDDGLSIGEVAGRLGVGHRTAKQLLHDFGIRQRTVAEQKLLDISRMDHHARLQMTEASRAIIKGRPKSHADLCKRAKTKQDRCVLSGDEEEIMAAYQAAGMNPTPLYALDKFNIDFAFPERMVAVEYNGGNWHNTPAKREADRIKADFLRAHGWTLIVLPRLDKPQANNAGNRRIGLDEIVRLTQQALHSCLPTVHAQ